MNDKEIREILISWIKNNDKELLNIREEMPTGNTRLDVTAFRKDKIIGYEIKGDNDVLIRLDHQVKCYEDVCDYCFIVVGQKYKLKAIERVPEHWGVLVVADGNITAIRDVSINTRQSNPALLNLCWKQELIDICRLKGLKGYSIPKSDLIEKLGRLLSLNEVRELIIANARWQRS